MKRTSGNSAVVGIAVESDDHCLALATEREQVIEKEALSHWQSITVDLEPSGTFGRWQCFVETVAILSVGGSTACDRLAIERRERVPVRD